MYSGAYLTMESGTFNITHTGESVYNYCNFTQSGGTCNISGYSGNRGGTLNKSGGTMNISSYLYNIRGYNSTMNISGGTLTCGNIPNYQGTINHSGGTIKDNGSYYEGYSDGGRYVGTGSAVLEFSGNNDNGINCQRSSNRSYFQNVKINSGVTKYLGSRWSGSGTHQTWDVNGYLRVDGTLYGYYSNDGNYYTPIDLEGTFTLEGTFHQYRDFNIAGNWYNSGSYNHHNSKVLFDGSSNSTITGSTTFYELEVNKSSNSYWVKPAASTTLHITTLDVSHSGIFDVSNSGLHIYTP